MYFQQLKVVLRNLNKSDLLHISSIAAGNTDVCLTFYILQTVLTRISRVSAQNLKSYARSFRETKKDLLSRSFMLSYFVSHTT